MPEEVFKRKIIQLPGAALSPETVLHRTLTKLAHIKAVAVVIQWDDSKFDIDWSRMTLGDLCVANKVLELMVLEEMSGKEHTE